LKIRFDIKSNLTSGICNFSKSQHLASNVSCSNDMAYDKEALGGMLVKEALSGALVKKVLGTSSLLFFVSSTLVEKALVGLCLLVMAHVLPQFVNGPFPVPVGGLLGSATSGKNPPPQMEMAGAAPRPAGLCAGHDQSNHLGPCRPSQKTQSGACGGGCIHLYCGHPEGSEWLDEDK
jgi:hypothetical protein